MIVISRRYNVAEALCRDARNGPIQLRKTARFSSLALLISLEYHRDDDDDPILEDRMVYFVIREDAYLKICANDRIFSRLYRIFARFDSEEIFRPSDLIKNQLILVFFPAIHFLSRSRIPVPGNSR